MKLVVAEKPSLAREIISMMGGGFDKKDNYYINSKYIVSWFYGHLLRSLKPTEMDDKYKNWKEAPLPILPDSLTYIYRNDTKKQGKLLADLAKKADTIINATDPDREGEGIFRIWYEKEQINKPVKRLWARSLAHEDLKKSWNEMLPSRHYDNLSIAQRLRAKSDWLVGMNGTMHYTRRAGTLIPIGRVKTATLAMVVNRDREVENYKESYKYSLCGNWNNIKFTYIEDKETKFDKKDYLENIKEKCTGIFSVIDKKEQNKKKNPPKTFSQPDLQGAANRRYKYSLDKTLKISQSLYEKKLITYPRTDSPYLPESELEYYHKLARTISSEKQKELLVEKEKKVPCVKNTEASHTALIPTGKSPENLTEEEKNIYNLIKERFVMAFMKPMVYKEETIKIKDDKDHVFRSIIRMVLDKGYTELYKDEDDNKDDYNSKNDITANDIKDNSINDLNIESIKSAKPKYFTPATLIKAMMNAGRSVDDKEEKEILKEVEGLGTAATRDQQPKNLLKEGYIYSKGNSLISTEKGRRLISIVNEDLKNPSLTARWEKMLREIEYGKYSPRDYNNKLNEFVRSIVNSDVNIENINQIDIECPFCREKLRSERYSYSCPKCEFKVSRQIAGKNITESILSKLVKSGKTEVLKGFKSREKKKEFSARLKIGDDKKVSFSFDMSTGLKCPKCGSDIVKFKAGQKCGSCDFIVWSKAFGKKLTDSQINSLIKNRRTSLIKGFKSKKGKTYNARLVLKDDFSTGLEFDN